MRTGLLLAAALLPGPAAAADPPGPPVVFQVRSLGQALDDLRGAAAVVSPDHGAKAVAKWLKGALGEKGFEGIDLNRPVVGYVLLGGTFDDATVVLAVPVTGEKEFLGLCERGGWKPRADARDKALHHLPRGVVRFADGHAYLVRGPDPVRAADPKALVAPAKLFDPTERAVAAARVYPDRIPLGFRMFLPFLLSHGNDLLLFDEYRLGRAERQLLAAVGPDLGNLVTRYLRLATRAEPVTVRLSVEPTAGTLTVEAAVAGKPGSDLSKMIAAVGPTGHRFPAVAAHPDTVAGFRGRLPLVAPELRAAAVGGVEALRKQAAEDAPREAKAVLKELFDGLARTAKGGEVDVAGAVRGPDPAGYFTVVGAAGVADPSGLEKEFKKWLEAVAPEELRDGVKWGAAKAGAVEVHTSRLPPFPLDREVVRLLGGDDAAVAFAFAPHAVVVAVGPDPAPAVKDAVAAKAADAPVFELVVNPARCRHLVRGFFPPGPGTVQFEDLFAREDKLKSAAALTVTGGKELTARLTVDLRVLPRLYLADELARAAREDEKIPKE